MPVTDYSAGELFRVTIVKYLLANPERKWANNYEMRALAAGGITEISEMGQRLVTMEAPGHLDGVKFDRLRISTWEVDSAPYNPMSFLSLPLAITGGLSAGENNPIALNVCYDVGRVPISGRFGHLYYRGCLVEENVSSPAGKFVLTAATIFNNALQNRITSSEVMEYLDGTSETWEMVMAGDNPATARRVISLIARGVAVVPFDHGWFNRSGG
jgi:hypothetical protein